MSAYVVSYNLHGQAVVDATDAEDAINLVDFDLAFWRGNNNWLDNDVLDVDIEDVEEVED